MYKTGGGVWRKTGRLSYPRLSMGKIYVGYQHNAFIMGAYLSFSATGRGNVLLGSVSTCTKLTVPAFYGHNRKEGIFKGIARKSPHCVRFIES